MNMPIKQIIEATELTQEEINKKMEDIYERFK